MNFQFSLDSIFPEDIMLIGRDLTPKVIDGSQTASTSSDYYSKHFCKLDPSSRLCLGEVLNQMGAASARAQDLSQVITTMEKLRTSDNHIVYTITHKDREVEGQDICVGFLKVGRKRLFILDSSSDQNEVMPVCVLDFYVHESLQRHGYGRQLFDAMLQNEAVQPAHLAIDRPSNKLTSFLAKHYDLRQPCAQVNNFVVYPGFFADRDDDVLFRPGPVHVSRTGSVWRRQASRLPEPVLAAPSQHLSFSESGICRRSALSHVSQMCPSPGCGCTQPETRPAGHSLGKFLVAHERGENYQSTLVSPPTTPEGRRAAQFPEVHPTILPEGRQAAQCPGVRSTILPEGRQAVQYPEVCPTTLPEVRQAAQSPGVCPTTLPDGRQAAQSPVVCPTTSPEGRQAAKSHVICPTTSPEGRQAAQSPVVCPTSPDGRQAAQSPVVCPTTSPEGRRAAQSPGVRPKTMWEGQGRNSPPGLLRRRQSQARQSSSPLWPHVGALHQQVISPVEAVACRQRSAFSGPEACVSRLPAATASCHTSNKADPPTAVRRSPLHRVLPLSPPRRRPAAVSPPGALERSVWPPPAVYPLCDDSSVSGRGPPAWWVERRHPAAAPAARAGTGSRCAGRQRRSTDLASPVSYPWMAPNDELFYPNKKRSPGKSSNQVASIVSSNGALNGSPTFSRHSHNGSPSHMSASSSGGREGGREVRNLHDHHQLW